MNRSTGYRSPLTTNTATTAPTALKARIDPLLRQPWFLCAMVLLVALMSTYVHVVNGQIERGERFRQGLAEAAKKPKAGSGQWLATASPQPLSAVGMDTRR